MKKNSLVSTNDVINSNMCKISACETKYKNKIVILSAIDNLIKVEQVKRLNMNIS